MRRGRKFAIVLLAAAVVVAAVYATGAFTSMTASRSVDVQVAGDGSAFLSLQPSEGPNGKYASYGPGGALQVTIGGAGGPSQASGVNPDSRTTFENVFTITNKGSQPVSVWITDNNPAVTFIQPNGTSLEAKASAVTIRPGGRSLHVGLVIDSRGVKPGANLLQSVTIHTDGDVSGVRLPASAPDGTAPGGSGARTSGDSPESSERRIGNVQFTNVVPVPRSLGDNRYYFVPSPVGGFDDSNQGFLETIARSLIPSGNLASLGTVLSQKSDDTNCRVNDDIYCPPHIPVDETPISVSARGDLKRILGVANRGEVKEAVDYILTSPDAYGRAGGYRYIIGTYSGDQSDEKITLWVNGDTVVAAERGGENSLTPPTAESVTLEPSPNKPADISLKDVPTPVLIALGVFPFDGGPTDEVVISSILVKRAVVAIAGLGIIAEHVDDLPEIHLPNPEIDAPEFDLPSPEIDMPEFHLPSPEIDMPEFYLPNPDIDLPKIDLPGWVPGASESNHGVSPVATSEFNSPPHDKEIILDNEYYNDHISHQEDHLTKQQIREVVENPDAVYKGKNRRGKTIYVWVQYVNGVARFVRAEDFSESDNIPLEGIQIRSAYENSDKDKLGDLKKAYRLIQIWPNNHKNE